MSSNLFADVHWSCKVAERLKGLVWLGDDYTNSSTNKLDSSPCHHGGSPMVAKEWNRVVGLHVFLLHRYPVQCCRAIYYIYHYH
jgi:hypothetical protein